MSPIQSKQSAMQLGQAGALLTELHVTDMEATYRRFAQIVGEATWQNRIHQLEAAIKGQPATAEVLRTDNQIAYSLEMCRRQLKERPNDAASPVFGRVLYPAISFAAQVMSVMDASTPEEADKLRRRVRGALKNPADSLRTQ